MKQMKNKFLIISIAILSYFHSICIAQNNIVYPNNNQRYYVNKPHFDPSRPCCQWVVPIVAGPPIQLTNNNITYNQYNNVGYQQQIQKDNCSFIVVYDNADDYNTNSQIQQLVNCQ
jgi:hypothetical protein